MSPVGAIFVPFPLETGTNLLHLRPPPVVERVSTSSIVPLGLDVADIFSMACIDILQHRTRSPAFRGSFLVMSMA